MSEFTNGANKSRLDIDFGDYVEIEQHCHDRENEWFQFKVIGQLNSNCWTDTPLSWNSEETLHKKMEDVLNVICCGIDETKVIRVKKSDCRLLPRKG